MTSFPTPFNELDTYAAVCLAREAIEAGSAPGRAAADACEIYNADPVAVEGYAIRAVTDLRAFHAQSDKERRQSAAGGQSGRGEGRVQFLAMPST